jgi:hypothetical protein
VLTRRHDWSDDGVCRICGLDGAEWITIARAKAEAPWEPMPECRLHEAKSSNLQSTRQLEP